MKKYNANGHYVLEEMNIFYEGGKLDLIPVFIKMNLFESMEDMGMSGDVTIIDKYSLTEILPLYGNEKFTVKFYTAGNEKNPVEFSGHIYKMTPDERITEHGSMITFHFCSALTMKSERMFVNRGYKDVTISDIVSDLYPRIEVPTKPLKATPTKGRHTVTLGNVHPLESISRLSGRAVSGSGDHGYVFFENHKNVVFKPIQELYNQKAAAKYTYQTRGVYKNRDNKYEEQFESVQEYEIYDENSILDRVYDGLHGSKHAMYDLITKDFLDDEDQYEYNKAEWFDRERSLGNAADRIDVEKKEDELFLTFGYGETDKLLHRDFVDSKMKRRESEIFRADLTVFGDSRLKCGDILEIYLPNYNIDQENIESIYNGNFLLSKVRHFLTQTEYMQVMHVKKDAYKEKSV